VRLDLGGIAVLAEVACRLSQRGDRSLDLLRRRDVGIHAPGGVLLGHDPSS
jgi:hypothetical protein